MFFIFVATMFERMTLYVHKYTSSESISKFHGHRRDILPPIPRSSVWSLDSWLHVRETWNEHVFGA